MVCVMKFLTLIFFCSFLTIQLGICQPQVNEANQIKKIDKNEIKENSKKDRWYLSLQWIGLTLHPLGGTHTEIYPWKLDKKAFLVFQPGGVVNVDFKISRRFFIRYGMSYYKDCAMVHSGYFHLGIRYVPIDIGRHSLNFGIGPTFLFREDWHQFSQYNTDPIFGDRVHKGWQYRFMAYAGEIEYLFDINDWLQLQYSLIPGLIVFTSKLGFRFKM
jgi:hypothetical protein